ncbi:hypothetical protein [Lentzea sp.]|uniref:hypothetical protein n=1 Tax=Lentzea sp. TaxID=56099 RepID=UPI002CD84A4C|nr:hypothetical protein [Lentzea sp.]HUQ55557.1 hypothetical protein [Lentzea sp.]
MKTSRRWWADGRMRVAAAELLNERPDLIWRMGDHARDDLAGPLWAESGAGLHEPWMRYDGVVPFGQIQGHSTVVDFGHQRWRCDGRVRQRATADWSARHVRVRVGGRLFIGVDPGHGRAGAQSWRPLVFDDADVQMDFSDFTRTTE